MRIPSARVVVGARTRSVAVHPAAAARDHSHASHAKVAHFVALQQREDERRAQGALVQSVVQRLQDAVRGVEGQVAQHLEQVGAIAVELGLALAREVVGGAVDRGLVDPTPIVRRCLEQCVAGGGGESPVRLEVRMNPGDLDAWIDHGGVGTSEVAVDVDPGLRSGEVVVTTGAGQLHYDPREVLERLADSVRSEVFAEVLGGGTAQEDGGSA